MPESEDAPRLFKRMQFLPKEQLPFNFTARDVTTEKRITGAVQVYFDKISQTKIATFKAAFPKTVRALFELARELVHGDFGLDLETEARSLDEVLFNEKNVLFLILIHSAQQPIDKFPEIFFRLKLNSELVRAVQKSLIQVGSSRLQKVIMADAEQTMDSQVRQDCALLEQIAGGVDQATVDMRALIQIFRDFLDNMAHPSHVAIKFYLTLDLNDEAILATKEIKNVVEQSKSLLLIIEKFLRRNLFNPAIELIPLLTTKQELGKALTAIVRKFLAMDKLEVAIAFIQSRTDAQEREGLLIGVVLDLMKYGQVELALRTTSEIEEVETREYTLSNIVQRLIMQGDYVTARHVISDLQDQGFREDAITYYLKGLLNLKLYEDAIHFVEALTDPREKRRAAKVITVSMLAKNENALADEVKHKFELAK